ncbi:MAG TPA: hypothetical protein VKY40_05910, partial [Halanaerobiales bacterium]|nr:hypothetical protein [Halanaerobiales bacterium]
RIISLSVLIGFASLMGFPFLAGYGSKYLIKYGYKGDLFFTVLLYAASVVTILYSMRFLYWSVFNRPEGRKKKNKVEDIAGIKIKRLVLIMILVLIIVIGIFAGRIGTVIGEIEFDLGFLIGLLEFAILLGVSILIHFRYGWFKKSEDSFPSLNPLFNSINHKFYNGGRYLYRLLYKEFQYQLLWIPLFLIILFLWYFIF